MYDLIIIGGGPAGVAAAIYAARKKLKTALISDILAGQSVTSNDIQNWIGEKHISGFDLAKKLEGHLREYVDLIDIKISEKVAEIQKKNSDGSAVFDAKTDKGNVYSAKAVILASGSRRRKLGVPGEERLDGKGVVYCSTCDAPLFGGKKVAVVGGGNAGLETARDLFAYASEVYLLEYENSLKGDEVMQEEIKNNPKLKKVILNSEVVEILGDEFVSGLKYKDRRSNEIQELTVEGIFVEIGSVPNSEMARGLVELDKGGWIVTDPQTGSTSCPGIFAAGDVTDSVYKQNNIAVGEAIKAALSAHAYLEQSK